MSILKEIFSEALPILEKYSPSISAILNSASSLSHSVVLPLLASAFNTDPSNLLGLASSIIENPEVQAKLGDLEKNFAAHILKIL